MSSSTWVWLASWPVFLIAAAGLAYGGAMGLLLPYESEIRRRERRRKVSLRRHLLDHVPWLLGAALLSAGAAVWAQWRGLWAVVTLLWLLAALGIFGTAIAFWLRRWDPGKPPPPDHDGLERGATWFRRAGAGAALALVLWCWSWRGLVVGT